MLIFYFLFCLALFILPILLLVSGAMRLKRIEKTLEQLLQASKSGQAGREVTQETSGAMPPPLPAVALVTEKIPSPSHPQAEGGDAKKERVGEVEDHLGAIFAWLRDDWILKVGALLLFAGLGWAVAYAAWNNWINPQTRVLGAVGLGAVFSFYGWRGLNTGGRGAATFLILGTAVILAAVFAGRVRHDLGSPAIALLVMFAATAVPAAASVRHGLPSLGRVALLGALTAPLLTSPPAANWPGLFASLAAVMAGFAWVVKRNGDLPLQWLAYGGVVLYAVNLWSGNPGYWDIYDPRHGMVSESAAAKAARGLADSVIPFAYAICGIFLATLTAAAGGEARRNGTPSSERGRRELIALWLVGGFFFAWTGWGIAGENQQFSLGAGALAFLITGLVSLRAGGYRLLLAHWSVSFTLATLALHKAINFPDLTSALAVLGCLTTGGVFFLTKSPRAALLASLSLFPSIAGGYYSLTSPEWGRDGWGLDAVAAVVGAIASVAGAIFLGKLAKVSPAERDLIDRASHGLALASAVLLLALAWLVAQAVLPGGSGTAVCLVFYAAVGIATYYAGSKIKHPCLRKYGTIIVLLVAARLLLVEAWEMDTPYRITVFITVGTLLLVSAKFARKWDSSAQKP